MIYIWLTNETVRLIIHFRISIIRTKHSNKPLTTQQVLFGATDSELSRLKLKRNVSNYHFIRQGGTPRVDSIADKSDYKTVQSAFKTLGFTTDQVDAIWRIVAAILHMVSVKCMTS